MKDKILFWLGSDFTHFCLAYYLQKMYDADLYAIVDITNRPKKFFQEQKLVTFQKIWYFHDHIKPNKTPDLQYLTSFEKKYNIDIWKLAINERIFYRFYNFHKFTSDEILSIDEQACKLFEQIIDEIKPDFFITKEPTFHHLELFYEFCRMKNIRVLMLGMSYLGGKCIISEESTKLDSNDMPLPQNNTKTFEELQNYVKSFRLSQNIREYDRKHARSKAQIITAAFKFLLSSNSNIHTHYNYYGRNKLQVITYMVASSLKKIRRQSFINKNLKHVVDLNVPFVYFPLAVDLERNQLVLTPYYTNQIEIIRHIAKSLPVGYKLYVKENPSQVTREWRKISDYKEIMDIPNVTLIHPSFHQEHLLKNCSLVITIGGSSGFEAACYGKPSIVFADVGYLLLPSVQRVSDIEELPNIIRVSLQKKVIANDLKKYLLLLNKHSIDFGWLDFGAKFKDHFYYGGSLVDIDVSQPRIQTFLEENREELEKLAFAHIEKIKEHKESKINISN